MYPSLSLYDMVDVGGFDLADVAGKTYIGLYNKLLTAMQSEYDIVLYNWYCAKILLPPSDVTLEMGSDNFISINGIIFVRPNDTVYIPSMGVLPVIEQLSVVENGTYVAPSGVDGYSPVSVAVPAGVLQALSITENGIYNPPSGVYGFSSVVADVSSMSSDLTYYLSHYGGGSEYSGYIYGTDVISNCHMVLLSDMSQNSSATSGTLSQSYRDFSALVLQGIYNKQRQSQYDTTMCYYLVTTGKAYWAGMKDRNSSYTCNVTLTGDTTFTLSGNKQVIIYGIP